MARSDAQKRADKKYKQKKIAEGSQRQFNVTLRGEDYNMIDDYCKQISMSKAACIVAAVKYCMDNDVDLKQVTTAPAPAEAETETSGTSEV